MHGGSGSGVVPTNDNAFEMAQTKQNFPQFASLRIPSRVRQPLRYSQPHLPSQAEEEDGGDDDDPGLDLIEAEVDSMSEENAAANHAAAVAVAAAASQTQQQQQQPLPAPRQTTTQQQQNCNNRQKPCYMNMPFPLRTAQSVDTMQVKTPGADLVGHHVVLDIGDGA